MGSTHNAAHLAGVVVEQPLAQPGHGTLGQGALLLVHLRQASQALRKCGLQLVLQARLEGRCIAGCPGIARLRAAVWEEE